jgi:NAD+ synthase
MNPVPPAGSFGKSRSTFGSDWLGLDASHEVARIAGALQEHVFRRLRRRGVVLGLSGGIDSSVCAALAVAALDTKLVLGVLMPERDSDPESLRLGKMLADTLGIETATEDIAPILKASGCYSRRDQFIRQLVPEFGEGWGCKVVLSGGVYNITRLVVESPAGERQTKRMPLDVYLGVVAATNMKQRTRKQLEYYHADRLHYAVLGTPNRLEYDQGFFVKNGDGAADIKPIAHLYKTQVYALAEHLGLPEEIRSRPPTTDTWSLAQSQEEFYFSVPYPVMDLCLYGLKNGCPAEEVAEHAGLTLAQVGEIWRNIKAKRAATRYLHQPPLLVEPDLLTS